VSVPPGEKPEPQDVDEVREYFEDLRASDEGQWIDEESKQRHRAVHQGCMLALLVVLVAIWILLKILS